MGYKQKVLYYAYIDILIEHLKQGVFNNITLNRIVSSHISFQPANVKRDPQQLHSKRGSGFELEIQFTLLSEIVNLNWLRIDFI